MPGNSGFITGEQVRVIRSPVDGGRGGPPVGTIGTVLGSGTSRVRVRWPNPNHQNWTSLCDRMELVVTEGEQPLPYDEPVFEGTRVRVVRFPADGDSGGPPVGSVGTVAYDGIGSISVLFDDWSYDGSGDMSERRWSCAADRLAPDELPTFYLVIIRDKKVERLGNYTFGNGKAAGEFAQRLSRELGTKVQPRRIAADVDSDTWRDRERERMGNGEYIAMPAEWDLEAIKDHFLHPSKDDPTKLAFIESPEKGVLDRQTRVTPGRYLERFYPHLSQTERNRYIAMIDKPDGLHFAVTADEIIATYTRGPSSCMSHPTEKFQSRPVHPVKPYAGGDLQVAYLKRDGAITARALVWPERKLYGRVYGDIARIERALGDAGYKHGPLVGARLTKIWNSDYERYIAPYVDFQKCLHDPDPSTRDGFLVIPEEGKGELSARHTDGFAHPATLCPKLGTYSIGQFYPVHVAEGRVEQWSEEATSRFATRVYDENGDRENFYPRERVVELEDFGPVLLDDVEKFAIKSDLTNKWVYKNATIVLVDGRKCSSREFRAHRGIICRGNATCLLPEHGYTLAGNGYTYSHAYLDEMAAKLSITRDELLEQKFGGARRVREARPTPEEIAAENAKIIAALEAEDEGDYFDEVDNDLGENELDAA